jgi:hypothetical protein
LKGVATSIVDTTLVKIMFYVALPVLAMLSLRVDDGGVVFRTSE